MVAIKDNKEYTVTEIDKQYYLDQGYDIFEDGKVIEYSPKKMIKFVDHLKEIEKVKADSNTDELEKKVIELTAELEKVTVEKTELVKSNKELTAELKKISK